MFVCIIDVPLGSSNSWISPQVIERKGAEVLVTRDCLSNLEGFRCPLAFFIGLRFLEISMILCPILQLAIQISSSNPIVPSGSTFQQTNMKVVVLQTEMWSLASMFTTGLRSWMSTGSFNFLLFCIYYFNHLLTCSGTTMTTRPTASATLTTGATLPTNSHLDRWQWLASSSSQFLSDDFQNLIVRLLLSSVLHKIIAYCPFSLAMANAIILPTCLLSLPWILATGQKHSVQFYSS